MYLVPCVNRPGLSESVASAALWETPLRWVVVYSPQISSLDSSYGKLLNLTRPPHNYWHRDREPVCRGAIARL